MTKIKKETKTAKTVKQTPLHPVTVSNNTFTTEIKWDPSVVKILQTIADSNLKMMELFVAQNVEVTALRIEQSQNTTK